MGMQFLNPLVISPSFILLFGKGNKVALDNNKESSGLYEQGNVVFATQR